MALIRGTLVTLLLALNLSAWGTIVLLVGAIKLLAPQGGVRRRIVLFLASLGERWAGTNNRIFNALLPTEWDIEGTDGLRRDARYLIFANHISWADIFVVFRALHGRVALIRFFTKQELIWLPIVGQAAWALEFPFMKRYSAEYLARHPEKRGADLATTRRACDRYRQIPVAILNFLEATRFTAEKHAGQESPYRHLLRPRIGAAAFVIACLGDQLDAILDVTIAYADPSVTAWDFVSGRVPRVVVRVRTVSSPPDPEGDRDEFRAWIEGIWREKDELLEDEREALHHRVTEDAEKGIHRRGAEDAEDSEER